MAKGTNDVVVVGGGVIGAAVAFHLAELGIKTVLIDRGEIAGGSTSKSGGSLGQHFNEPYRARLGHESLAYFRDWKNRVGVGDPGFHRCGTIVTATPSNIPALRENVKMLQAIGVNTHIVSADDIRRLQPWANTDDLDVGAYEPDSGCAMPAATARSFADAARKHGAEIITDQQVTAIRTEGGRVAGVSTVDGDWSASLVIVCTGAWSVPLFRELGVDLPITANRAGAFLLERQRDLPRGMEGHMVFLQRGLGCYFRPYGETETLAGGGGRSRPARSADDFDPEADDKLVEDVRQLVGQRIPAMKGAKVTRGWSGITDGTPDSCPILEANLGAEGLFLAAGFSGLGFKISPYVGYVMASWLATGERPDAAAPFTFSRFVQGDLLTPKHPYVIEHPGLEQHAYPTGTG